MRAVFDAVIAANPQAIALRGAAGEVTYAELQASVEHAAGHLRDAAPHVVGLALDNGPAWAVVDLAAMQAGVPLVPLPFFFSSGQLSHAIKDAGIDCVHTDQPEQFEKLFAEMHIAVRERNECRIHGQAVTEFRLDGVPLVALPPGTAKITYTSGTTGSPKGVCLGVQAMEQVAHSLLEATGACLSDRHVSLMPLSTLLENIAGLYVPLLAGATAVLLPFAEIGLRGASGLDVQKMAGSLLAHEATTTILTPEMLRGLVAVAAAGHPMPSSLRFVAVGGAPVAELLLRRASALGMPVFEGYGLSECASVVSLNTAAANAVGSAGRPLLHVHLAFSPEGEILAAGAVMLGYTGNAECNMREGYWPTGDLGFVDAKGYLHITGRKKNIFITSFGRNVAPEWVERELTLSPDIAQAAVFGEGRPWNVAVIVPRGNTPEVAARIEHAIADANARLPDYARIRSWLPAQAPFTPVNGQMTPNGRLRRDAIRAVYQEPIEHLYKENEHAVL
jgi:long-chain acyl-CoA synthetase